MFLGGALEHCVRTASGPSFRCGINPIGDNNSGSILGAGGSVSKGVRDQSRREEKKTTLRGLRHVLNPTYGQTVFFSKLDGIHAA